MIYLHRTEDEGVIISKSLKRFIMIATQSHNPRNTVPMICLHRTQDKGVYLYLYLHHIGVSGTIILLPFTQASL